MLFPALTSHHLQSTAASPVPLQGHTAHAEVCPHVVVLLPCRQQLKSCQGTIPCRLLQPQHMLLYAGQSGVLQTYRVCLLQVPGAQALGLDLQAKNRCISIRLPICRDKRHMLDSGSRSSCLCPASRALELAHTAMPATLDTCTS